MAISNFTPNNHQMEITDLPFVKNVNDERSFWSVQATGSYPEDCAIGQMYANEAARYIKQTGATYLLAWIANEMPIKLTGIEAGFFNTIAGFSARGAQI
jgi:hypothetical protein